MSDVIDINASENVGDFFSLTPDHVLEAVERSGNPTTGLCYPLNSLENRVYEVELEDRTRVITKFYRPGRWGRDTILDEHRLLAALVDIEIPACAPIPFADGSTLHQTASGISFTLFPKVGGRAPEELTIQEYEQLGRLLGRIHNASAALDLQHRPMITPESYGTRCLSVILDKGTMSDGVKARYQDAVSQLVSIGQQRFQDKELMVIHGDCHKGNLLRGPEGWFFLDFDDMGQGPPAQDLWLLLPARREESKQEIEALVTGYEQFRAFDHSSLRLIELLRGLRYVRYAAWITSRWDDPSFKRAFDTFGDDRYWEQQTADIYEQISVLQVEDIPQY